MILCTQFLTKIHNLTTPISIPEINFKIPNPALPLFRNLTSIQSILNFSMKLPQPLLPTPTQHQYFPPMTSDQPEPPSPVTEALENELDHCITLQQLPQNNNTLTIHQLSHSISFSEYSNQTPTALESRAIRVFKRKLSNAQPHVLHQPRPTRLFSIHPLHTNTKELLKYSYPFFPQYTYYQTTNNDQLIYVDDYSLFQTLSLSWTSYYHFTSPLAHPLFNNPADNEICQPRLQQFTN